MYLNVIFNPYKYMCVCICGPWDIIPDLSLLILSGGMVPWVSLTGTFD